MENLTHEQQSKYDRAFFVIQQKIIDYSRDEEEAHDYQESMATQWLICMEYLFALGLFEHKGFIEDCKSAFKEVYRIGGK